MDIVTSYNDDLNSAIMLSGIASTWTFDTTEASAFSVQVNTTQRGDLFAATFKLDATNDGGDNYAPLSGYINHTSGTESFMWRVADPDFIGARVSYENVSGSGLVEVWPAVRTFS